MFKCDTSIRAKLLPKASHVLLKNRLIGTSAVAGGGARAGRAERVQVDRINHAAGIAGGGGGEEEDRAARTHARKQATKIESQV